MLAITQLAFNWYTAIVVSILLVLVLLGYRR